MIIVVGDSHVEAMFSGVRTDVKVIGPKVLGQHRTAYKLVDHEDNIKNHIGETEKKILFVFGEIDCRYHIAQKAEKIGVHVLKQIDKTAKRYLSFVKKLRSEGFNIAVLSVEPQARYQGECRIPYEKRVMIAESMNYAFKRYCRYFKIPFFDIYTDLINIDGTRKQELIQDPTHLGRKAGDIFLKKGFEW